MPNTTDIQIVYAKSRGAWRKWLQKNHDSSSRIWLEIFKKDSGTPSVNYVEAVEEALCFGWIDSKANKKDEKSYYQSFAKRNPKSKWSKINKGRVKKMIEEKRMTPAGLKAVAIARKNGSWTALTTIDNIILPDDLQASLSKTKMALRNFNAFPPSSKKIILLWILDAKTVTTRKKRISETVTLAAQNIRANHWTKS